MKIKIFTFISLIILSTSFSYAATLGFGSLVELADTLATGVVTSLGYLMFALAVVAFLFGMVKFIWAARNGDAGKGVENGKQFMLWGLIALFVMFSVWGIIIFLQGIFNIKGNTSIVIPNIELLGSSPSSANQTGLANPAAAVVPSANPSAANGLQSANPSAADALQSAKVEGSPCTTIVCSTPGNPSSCINITGHNNAYNQCVADGANSRSPASPASGAEPLTSCTNGACPNQTTEAPCSSLSTVSAQTTCFQGKVCNLIASESERALCLKLKATIPYAQYSSKDCGLIVSESDRETCKIVKQANK